MHRFQALTGGSVHLVGLMVVVWNLTPSVALSHADRGRRYHQRRLTRESPQSGASADLEAGVSPSPVMVEPPPLTRHLQQRLERVPEEVSQVPLRRRHRQLFASHGKGHQRGVQCRLTASMCRPRCHSNQTSVNIMWRHTSPFSSVALMRKSQEPEQRS